MGRKNRSSTRIDSSNAVAPASTPVLSRSSSPSALASTSVLDGPGDEDGLVDDAGLRRRNKDAIEGLEAAGWGFQQEDLADDDLEDEDADEDGSSEMLRWGWTLVVGSSLAFFLGFWSIVVGPFCAPTGIRILDALAKDTYYKYLVILLVPVTVCYVIVNWWGLKIFRHA
ncbi:hypothetical protein RTBOTA2_002989 [Rhodotorula toruloides]|uniref:Transmembrane protein n=1 Tax=Rhodotorula toruloides TaxID=5286 RepID=A0A0K3CD43_RHOTO|nr:hypothetical protein RTBOTA2_002989 [Rhodotorula toruloides]PRQ74981.1 hypothetical protein AAT19DRAFT_14003 [Rhodotorula toruloides]